MLAWLGGKRRLLDTSSQHANKRARPSQSARHKPASLLLDTAVPLPSHHSECSYAANTQPIQTNPNASQKWKACSSAAHHAAAYMGIDMLMVAPCGTKQSTAEVPDEAYQTPSRSAVAGSATLEDFPRKSQQPVSVASNKWLSASNVQADMTHDQASTSFKTQTSAEGSAAVHKANTTHTSTNSHAAAEASGFVVQETYCPSSITKRCSTSMKDLADAKDNRPYTYKTPPLQQKHAPRSCRASCKPAAIDAQQTRAADLSAVHMTVHRLPEVEPQVLPSKTVHEVQDSLEARPQQQQQDLRPQSLDLLFLCMP